MCKRVTEKEIEEIESDQEYGSPHKIITEQGSSTGTIRTKVKMEAEKASTIKRGVLLHFAKQIEEVAFLDSLPSEDIKALLSSRGLPAIV